MRKVIRREKIVDEEERPLSADDLDVLTLMKKRQLTFWYSGYIPMALVLLLIFTYFVERGSWRIALWAVGPITGFSFIALNIYFIRFYLRDIAPVIKDIKANKKLLLHFVPEKIIMTFYYRYEKFYLSTPVIKREKLEVHKEDFYRIPDGAPIIVEVTPYSQTILRFTYDGKECEVPMQDPI